MYDILKQTHYVLMILLLVLLLFTIFRFAVNANQKKPFGAFEDKQSLAVLILTHIQLLIGLILLFSGPWASYFSQMGEVMGNSDLRFKVVEHPTTMILAVVAVTIGRARGKRQPNDAAKFKQIALFYGIGLLLMVIRIPWSTMGN